MRWTSLLSTVALTAASIAVPRMLFRSIGLDSAGLASISGTVSQISSGRAVDDRLMGQFRALQGGQTETVSLQQLAAVQDVLRESDAGRKLELAAALRESFKAQKPVEEKFRAGVLRDAERVRVFYRGERQSVLLLLGALGAACLAVAVLGAFPFGRAAARFFLTMLFALSCHWMVLFSLGTAAFFWISGFNPWPVLPGEALAAPAAYMLLCGLFVRQLDPNYPLWNSLLRALGAPIAACLVISGAGAAGVGADSAQK